MNLLSYLKMSVYIDTWRAATGLFGNDSMGSSITYLTKRLRCIVCSLLLLIIILFLLFTVRFYDENLGLMTFLSLHVFSINIKRNFFSKFSNFLKRLYISSRKYVFLFIITLYISDIISAFWRYRNKSRSRPRLLEEFCFLSLELK